MRRLILARLIDLLTVLFGVSIIVFLMIRLIPGDAVQIMLGANTEITPERLAALYHRLGIDRPILEQYFLWLAGVLQGDLGRSVWTGAPVAEEIIARIGVTAELMATSLTLAVVLAIPAGCLMAYVRRSAGDYAIRLVTIAGITVPSFWLGIVLIYVFYNLAPNFQAVGYVPFRDDPVGNLSRLLLPTIALSLPILAALSRILRTAMLDALGQDYVRTARGKGVSEAGVVFRHALRNALIPFVTAVGIIAGYLFGGTIVVEQVFALPGLGRLIIGAIAERNYPLIQAAILLVTSGFVVINFLVDLLYAAIDPRVQGE
ncbi:MAG: ABC transporter permease [Proteobacteria bacterium]|nr:ABC transporter permease [Pseudomonadota bacterium]MBI3498109.1 ABC transporter permease [Pseudomonadota bacterium]